MDQLVWCKVEGLPGWEFSAGLVRHTSCRNSEPGKPAETSWIDAQCAGCGDRVPQALRRAALRAEAQINGTSEE